jgi:hypothetical protein
MSQESRDRDEQDRWQAGLDHDREVFFDNGGDYEVRAYAKAVNEGREACWRCTDTNCIRTAIEDIHKCPTFIERSIKLQNIQANSLTCTTVKDETNGKGE